MTLNTYLAPLSDLHDEAAEANRQRLRQLGWTSHYGDIWSRPGSDRAVTEVEAMAWLAWRDGVVGGGDSDEGEY